jgi:uncharacterized protein with HEPN domain
LGIDHDRVWLIVEIELPRLGSAVSELLAQMDLDDSNE